MSKKCPHCGSYNTEAAVINWVGRGLLNAGRGVLALGAGLIGGIIMPGGGAGALGSKTWQNTKPTTPFNGYRCCNCGKEFSA